MIAVSSKGQSFRALAAYLVHGRTGEEQGRIAWSSARNLPTNDPELAATMMRATAEQSVRVRQPVYHLVLSFDPTDPVDRAMMERVADRVLHRLGLTEHQAVIVSHQDRAHAHLHVLVNRIHPTTRRAWEMSFDYRAIQEVIRAEERLLGLREVPGRYSELPGRDIGNAREHRMERTAEDGIGSIATPTHALRPSPSHEDVERMQPRSREPLSGLARDAEGRSDAVDSPRPAHTRGSAMGGAPGAVDGTPPPIVVRAREHLPALRSARADCAPSAAAVVSCSRMAPRQSRRLRSRGISRSARWSGRLARRFRTDCSSRTVAYRTGNWASWSIPWCHRSHRNSPRWCFPPWAHSLARSRSTNGAST